MTGICVVFGVLAAGLLLVVYACLVQAGRADRQAEEEARRFAERREKQPKEAVSGREKEKRI